MENNEQRWQVERKLGEDGTHQNFITHLKEPQFSARVVKIDPFENQPIPNEGQADITSGFVYPWNCTTVLCQIAWTPTPTPTLRDHWLSMAAYTYQTFSGHFMLWKLLPPIQDMADRLKLDISACRKWSDYTVVFRYENDRSGGQLVERIRKLACVVSTGELPVLQAMLQAANYSQVAGELGGDDNWHRLSRTSGDHAEAVALAIMRAGVGAW